MPEMETHTSSTTRMKKMKEMYPGYQKEKIDAYHKHSEAAHETNWKIVEGMNVKEKTSKGIEKN